MNLKEDPFAIFKDGKMFEDSKVKKAKVGKGSTAEFDCSDTNNHDSWRTIDFKMEKGSKYKVNDNCKGW